MLLSLNKIQKQKQIWHLTNRTQNLNISNNKINNNGKSKVIRTLESGDPKTSSLFTFITMLLL